MLGLLIPKSGGQVAIWQTECLGKWQFGALVEKYGKTPFVLCNSPFWAMLKRKTHRHTFQPCGENDLTERDHCCPLMDPCYSIASFHDGHKHKVVNMKQVYVMHSWKGSFLKSVSSKICCVYCSSCPVQAKPVYLGDNRSQQANLQVRS